MNGLNDEGDGDDFGDGLGVDQQLPSLSPPSCSDVNELLAEHGDWTVRADVQVVFSLVYAAILTAGLVGNGLLIGSVAARRRKRTSVANCFLVNLAVSDLLLCITAVPITPILAFLKRWPLGVQLCKLVPACQAVSVLISSYCLCFIAVDRYRSIVTPLKEPWTLRTAKTLIASSWLAAAVLASPLYFMQTLRTLTIQDADDRTLLLCGEFLVPALLMTACYWHILQKVRSDWLVVGSAAGSKPRSNASNNSNNNNGNSLLKATSAVATNAVTEQQCQQNTAVRKRRVMYVLMLMVVVFMASWLPLTIVNLVKDFGEHLGGQFYFKLLNVHAIAMTSVVWNPLLYFWMSKRHRRALKDDMVWLTNQRRQVDASGMVLFSRLGGTPSNASRLFAQHRSSTVPQTYNVQLRRGTLADPTCVTREGENSKANCLLLMPLLPLCKSPDTARLRRGSHVPPSSIRHGGELPPPNSPQARFAAPQQLLGVANDAPSGRPFLTVENNNEKWSTASVESAPPPPPQPRRRLDTTS